METVIVIATHPDDETFGAGGYILKTIKNGGKVFVLNITNMSIESGFTESQIIKRNSEISGMCNKFQLDGYYDLGLSPARLDNYTQSELITKISKIFNEVKPSTVILPYYADIHSDHRITFDICYSCTKSFRYPSIKKILMMETPSETDYAASHNAFTPDYFVDITEFIDKKIEIASLFKSEISSHPFPRSILNLKSYGIVRGAACNVNYAEAFKVLKIIE